MSIQVLMVTRKSRLVSIKYNITMPWAELNALLSMGDLYLPVYLYGLLYFPKQLLLDRFY